VLKINGLIKRLKIGHPWECPKKQGEMVAPIKFPPDLSTETVDAFLLAAAYVSVQGAKESHGD
jgi:hypothetical protein